MFHVDRRIAAIGMALSFILLLVSPALAHSGGGGEPNLQIDPNPVTAGNTITLVGTNLEPNGDRQLTLAGQDLIVDFGTVKTDADGMLKTDLKIPAYLPAGTYEIRASADEVLTVECDVQAGAGAISTSGGAPELAAVPRERGAVELAIIASVVALSSALGVLLVWRTRQHGVARSR